MKTKLYIFLCVPLLSAPVRAENLKINSDNLRIGLMGLIPVFVFQTFVHERTHAAIAKSQGAKIVDFSFFPTRKDGQFNFGLTTAEWPKGPTDGQAAYFYIAPAITNLIVFSATETAFALNGIDCASYLAPVIFLVGEFGPWVDFTRRIIASNDISQFEKKSGVPLPVTRTVGAAVSLLGGYLLIKRAKKIFWRPAKKTVVRRVKLTPFSDIGASITMEF